MKEKLQQMIINNSYNVVDIVDVEMSLSREDNIRYQAQLAAESKSSTTSWILWFFLGYFHVHMFYLGVFDSKHMKGLRIAAMVTGYFLMGIPMFIFWIYDAVKMKNHINDSNNAIKAKILLNYVN